MGEPVQVGRATQFKMRSSIKAKLYDTFTIDKKCGNLPVSVVRADESGERIVEKIQTVWGAYEGTYLPKSVNILMYQRIKGGTSAPSKSWTAKYHWAFKALPSSVFTNESGSFMEPTQLLDFVLTNEVKAADAK